MGADGSSLSYDTISLGAGGPWVGDPSVVDGDWAGGKAIVVGVDRINGVGGIIERSIYEVREIEVATGGDGEIEREREALSRSAMTTHSPSSSEVTETREQKRKDEYEEIAKKLKEADL